ncbi:hypothetical protein Nepgr_014766 [Nepenthes gracilis]|uniref:Uncharacterized protein n=1 Tax=Nepenthes gracilis TaxID=150966 RepID=A0AAD3SLI6_NEPGR|nr:hypothetical protein Nepgr_014766 [Nepenthes gracilis]
MDPHHLTWTAEVTSHCKKDRSKPLQNQSRENHPTTSRPARHINTAYLDSCSYMRQVVPLGEAVISVSEQEVSDSIPKVPLELAMPSESAKEVPEGMESRNSDMQKAISSDFRV